MKENRAREVFTRPSHLGNVIGLHGEGSQVGRVGSAEMNGRTHMWRHAQRVRRTTRWNVRLTLAEARMRRELAWRYGW